VTAVRAGQRYSAAIPLRLALLGDSVAWGQGASLAAERPAARLARGLADHDIFALTNVLAVPGARSADLRRQVDGALAWHPDVSLVVIGANDLINGVAPEQAAADLADGVRRLRDAHSEVVVAPAPDLSAVPHVPAELRSFVQSYSEELRHRQMQTVTALGARIADADHGTARAFGADLALFSTDRFHPSSKGYAVIVDVLLPEVLAAAVAH
jgi:lysophospholipase L1-like esterase